MKKIHSITKRIKIKKVNKNQNDQHDLIVALDFSDLNSAKKMVEELGEEVMFYKLGLELMASGFYFELVDWLKNKDKKIFADLKLYDISETVARTIKNLSKYQIDILTIHTASKEIMLRASENKGLMKVVGVTILTSLDEKDLQEIGFDKNFNLTELVAKKTKLALESGLDGIVCSAMETKKLRDDFGKNFLIINPGIRLEKIANDDQKRVCDVLGAIKNGCSKLVVGRPITRSEKPKEQAILFNQKINEAKTDSFTS